MTKIDRRVQGLYYYYLKVIDYHDIAFFADRLALKYLKSLMSDESEQDFFEEPTK